MYKRGLYGLEKNLKIYVLVSFSFMFFYQFPFIICSWSPMTTMPILVGYCIYTEGLHIS